jgi:hypothetical protein
MPPTHISLLKFTQGFLPRLLLALGIVIDSDAAKTTVCTITVNSPNEKDAFRRNLPKDKFEFVELLERGRRDWLASACQQKVQCDVLVISGHFGGDAAVHAENATGSIRTRST